MNEPMNQPLLAPLAAGGGIVAGVSAAIIAAWQVGDCLAFKTRYQQCDGVINVGVPAMVAGFGSVVSTVGGLWTYNRRLRSPGKESRQRDEHGRFLPEN